GAAARGPNPTFTPSERSSVGRSYGPRSHGPGPGGAAGVEVRPCSSTCSLIGPQYRLPRGHAPYGEGRCPKEHRPSHRDRRPPRPIAARDQRKRFFSSPHDELLTGVGFTDSIISTRSSKSWSPGAA